MDNVVAITYCETNDGKQPADEALRIGANISSVIGTAGIAVIGTIVGLIIDRPLAGAAGAAACFATSLVITGLAKAACKHHRVTVADYNVPERQGNHGASSFGFLAPIATGVAAFLAVALPLTPVATGKAQAQTLRYP